MQSENLPGRWALPGLILPTVLLGLSAGCSDSPPVKRTMEAELSVGIPAGGGDSDALSDSSFSAPELRDLQDGAATRLASAKTESNGKSKFDSKLEDLKKAIQPPQLSDESVQFVQRTQRPPRPELVPTPNPKIDAEIVPTPDGLRNGKSDAATKPDDYNSWPSPAVALFVTGQQHGYIEPCGCTGLDNQKGGVARRYTLMKQLRQRGWDLIPIDAGNQVRRIGQQASIKLSWSSESLKKMKYEAVGFGPDDLRLSAIDLIQVAAAESPDNAMYISANLVIIDPSFVPAQKIVDRGEVKVGITSILDPGSLPSELGEDFNVKPLKESAGKALQAMNDAGATFRVLSFFGTDDKSEEAAKRLALAVPGFDLIIAAGGYGEPTFQPQEIQGSKTKLIVTGNKAMYAGLVGVYKDAPMKYARVALTHDFSDAPEMRKLMADYQQQLQDIGLEGLGLRPIRHSSGDQFVGSAVCGKCHKTAFEIWESSGHAYATESLVEPPEDRGDVPRHFDPECISCHVTGWNPQRYYPYETGYLSLADEHLHGSGCENCHGPGAGHSKAEEKNSGVGEEERYRLQLTMRLPLDKAREQCMECHDLDNSPDFHEEDAFEDIYWPEVEHYGLD